MSRPARWGHTTGRLYRQAAALSGKEIRACVRIAAGACPGVHQLGKGFVKDAFPGFGFDASLSSSLRLRPPPYRGANAPILSHFACGGPSLGHPQSGDRSSSSPPRELTGRQPIQEARCGNDAFGDLATKAERLAARLRDASGTAGPRAPADVDGEV